MRLLYGKPRFCKTAGRAGLDSNQVSASVVAALRPARAVKRHRARPATRAHGGYLTSARQRGERAPLSVARVGRLLAAALDLHRAVLELRDLAEGVEHRVREQVRRGLIVRKRYEHRAARRAGVGARIEGNLAAPRADRDEAAGANAQRIEVERMQGRYRRGFDGVEHAGTARHGAGVPVLE